MTAHASDARTQKRSSLKGNRDTRRARLPRQQPPGRHGIVSPNRNQKEPAMPASKPAQSRPPPRSATRATAQSSSPSSSQKAVPGMERHHAFGSPTSWATNAPRGGLALASAASSASSSSTDATGKIRITRPSITSLPARCSTDLRSRETAIDTQDEKASDHPARHNTWTAAHAAI